MLKWAWPALDGHFRISFATNSGRDENVPGFCETTSNRIAVGSLHASHPLAPRRALCPTACGCLHQNQRPERFCITRQGDYSWTGSNGQCQVQGGSSDPRIYWYWIRVLPQPSMRFRARENDAKPLDGDMRPSHRAIPAPRTVKRKENQSQNTVKLRCQNWLEFCK